MNLLLRRTSNISTKCLFNCYKRQLLAWDLPLPAFASRVQIPSGASLLLTYNAKSQKGAWQIHQNHNTH